MKKFLNTNRKILFIMLIFLLTFMCTKVNVVYAKIDSKQLKELLVEYKDDLGDLKQLKVVIDETYNELKNATKVDDNLKQKLNTNISKFNDIDGINPLIKTVITIELKSQVNDLTNDNIGDMLEEITVIKEWIDNELGDSANKLLKDNANDTTDDDDDDDDDESDSADDDDDDGDDDDYYDGDDDEEDDDDDDDGDVQKLNSKLDKSLSGQSLPGAGVTNIIITMLIIIVAISIFFIIRYKQLKDID